MKRVGSKRQAATLLSADAFGAYLRKVRKDRGYSLGDVQKQTGISKGHLSLLENGRVREPALASLLRLAECYDLSLVVLLEQLVDDHTFTMFSQAQLRDYLVERPHQLQGLLQELADDAEWRMVMHRLLQQAEAVEAAEAKWESLGSIEEPSQVGSPVQPPSTTSSVPKQTFE